MAERVLLDTGPIFAIASTTDPDHLACVAALRTLSAPLLTTWPVLTEAVYLLRGRRDAVGKLLSHVEQGSLYRVVELDDAFLPWTRAFFERFRDREPQLADASLVYLAEREGIETVFTLDSRDFSVYRTSQGRALRIVPQR